LVDLAVGLLSVIVHLYRAVFQDGITTAIEFADVTADVALEDESATRVVSDVAFHVED